MRSRATFPPVQDRFLFPGRTGHPPREPDSSTIDEARLGWSPVFPRNFGKETGVNETRFWKSP
jgi:hypothetical protein